MSSLSLLEIPWDSKVIGKPTFEIRSSGSLDEQLDFEIKDLPVGNYYFSRVDSNNILLKKYFLKNGFYPTEHSAEIFCSDISSSLENSRYKKNIDISSIGYSTDELDQVLKVAEFSFKHGRIDEDPFLADDIKRARRTNWITDLMNQNTPGYVYKVDGKIKSFMFYKIKNSEAELILGGSDSDSGFYTPFFWHNVFKSIHEVGINKLRTRISFSNTVILNLYIQFGFRIVSSEQVLAKI